VLAVAALVVFLWPGGAGTPATTTASIPDPVIPTTTLPPGAGAETEPSEFVPGVGWETLQSPVDGRLGPAAAWTGDELFVWGGFPGTLGVPDLLAQDGHIFDPGEGWYAVPPQPRPPLCTLSSARALAAGTAVVLWGRTRESEGCATAQAYDATSRQWRALDGEFFDRVPPDGAVVWAGDWGDAGHLVAPVAGLALDLASGATREIPAMSGTAPDGSAFSPVTAHWTGERVLAIGSGSLHSWAPGEPVWTDLGPPPVADGPRSAAWTDEGLVVVASAWSGSGDATPGPALWSPSGGWTSIEAPPLRSQGYSVEVLSIGGRPAVATTVGVAVLDDGGWVPFPPAYLLGCCLERYVAAADALYAVGPRTLRLALDVVDGRVVAPRTLRVGLFYLDLPDGARFGAASGEAPVTFPDGSTGSAVGVTLDTPGGNCAITATAHDAEPSYPAPPVELEERTGRDDRPLALVQVESEGGLLLAVPHPNGIDVLRVGCDDPADALALARGVWLPVLDI